MSNERLAKHFPHLSEVEMEQKYKHGDKKWPTRVRSVKNRLVKNGEVVSSARGEWRITDKGKDRFGK